MPKPKRMPRVLFVDDDKLVHIDERAAAKKLRLRPRFAFSPGQAERIIIKRLAAVQRLQKIKEQQLEKTTDKKKRRILLRQLRVLKQIREKPFDLIVSDINMPRGVSTGMGFARAIKKQFPKQKLMMHSDDLENLDLLEREHNIPFASKLSWQSQKLLEETIKAQLKKKKKN